MQGNDPEELLGPRAGTAGQAAADRRGDAEPEPAPTREPVEKTAHVKGLEDDCVSAWRSRSRSSVKAKDKGQIVIAFDSNDDFERILDALKK